MSARAALAATAAAMALVWIGANELAWPARILTVGLVAALPALLLGQSRIAAEEAAAIPRRAIYVSSIVAIWTIALLCAMAAVLSGWPAGMLSLRPVGLELGLVWTGGVALLGLAVIASARLLRLPESPLVERLIPRDNGERALFVIVSLSAGIGEELAFRGFLLPALQLATGSTGLAVAISSAAFGMLHSYQQPHGVLRATALGAALAAPVLATGSLLPAIAAHALIDLVAGLWLADWLLARDNASGRPPRDH